MISVDLLRRNLAVVIFRPAWWQFWRRETERFVERVPTIPTGSVQWLYDDGMPVCDVVRRAIDAEEMRLVWAPIWSKQVSK